MTLAAAIANVRAADLSGRAALRYLHEHSTCLFVGRPQATQVIETEETLVYRIGGWTQSATGERAIYATPWPDVAIFQALVHPTTMRGLSAFVARVRLIEGQPRFEASGDVVERAMMLTGYVHVIPRTGFRCMSDLEWRGRIAVRAAHIVAISGAELPAGIISRSVMGELLADADA